MLRCGCGSDRFISCFVWFVGKPLGGANYRGPERGRSWGGLSGGEEKSESRRGLRNSGVRGCPERKETAVVDEARRVGGPIAHEEGPRNPAHWGLSAA